MPLAVGFGVPPKPFPGYPVNVPSYYAYEEHYWHNAYDPAIDPNDDTLWTSTFGSGAGSGPNLIESYHGIAQSTPMQGRGVRMVIWHTALMSAQLEQWCLGGTNTIDKLLANLQVDELLYSQEVWTCGYQDDPGQFDIPLSGGWYGYRVTDVVTDRPSADISVALAGAIWTGSEWRSYPICVKGLGGVAGAGQAVMVELTNLAKRYRQYKNEVAMFELWPIPSFEFDVTQPLTEAAFRDLMHACLSNNLTYEYVDGIWRAFGSITTRTYTWDTVRWLGGYLTPAQAALAEPGLISSRLAPRQTPI